jgi:hypothetical protein
MRRSEGSIMRDRGEAGGGNGILRPVIRRRDDLFPSAA